MELRRALLLFAIVLGVAAIATSFSRPARRGEDRTSDSPRALPTTPTANPRRGPEPPAMISFSSSGRPRTRLLSVNRQATVTVEVTRPGQVELAGLGRTAAADPLTPARFDVLERQAGRYLVRFSPATSSERRTLGALQIVPG